MGFDFETTIFHLSQKVKWINITDLNGAYRDIFEQYQIRVERVIDYEKKKGYFYRLRQSGKKKSLGKKKLISAIELLYMSEKKEDKLIVNYVNLVFITI